MRGRPKARIPHHKLGARAESRVALLAGHARACSRAASPPRTTLRSSALRSVAYRLLSLRASRCSLAAATSALRSDARWPTIRGGDAVPRGSGAAEAVAVTTLAV